MIQDTLIHELVSLYVWTLVTSVSFRPTRKKRIRMNLCFSTMHEQIKNIGFMDQSVLYHGSHQKIIVYGIQSDTGQNFF